VYALDDAESDFRSRLLLRKFPMTTSAEDNSALHQAEVRIL
jgi:hypothetical protein